MRLKKRRDLEHMHRNQGVRVEGGGGFALCI